MREILFSNKSDAVKFILGSFLQSVLQLSYSVAVAILIGMIPEATLPHFWRTVGWVSLLLLLLPFIQIAARLLRIKYMKDRHIELRQRVFDRIMALDFRTFGKRSGEEYISVLTNDMLAFENTFFPTLQTIISSLGIFLLSFLVLLYFDFKLAFLIIFLSGLLYLILRLFEKRTVRMQAQVLRMASKVTVSEGNTLSGLELLKLNNLEGRFLTDTVKSMEKLEVKKMGFNIFLLTQKQLTNFIGSLIFITIIFYSGKIMIRGADLTRVALMVGLANNMVWPVTEILPLVNQLRAVTDAMRKHINIRPESFSEGKLSFSFEDRIKAEKISYRYGIRNILKDADFEILKGKKYLIRGPSGSGKSTLLKVLSKTVFDYTGKIFFDDVRLRDISDVSFSENTAFIYQDVFLLEDTLRNNLTLYKEIDDGEIMEAVEKAGLTGFLAKNPEGLDTFIAENGKNLSGGERQRISIARAILKKACILFADEASSSLDEATSIMIDRTLLSGPQTVIAISHKVFPETLDLYDYVLEVRSGRVYTIPAGEFFSGVKR